MESIKQQFFESNKILSVKTIAKRCGIKKRTVFKLLNSSSLFQQSNPLESGSMKFSSNCWKLSPIDSSFTLL